MRRLTHNLYLQVLLAVACGALLGHFHPSTGAAMRPLGEGFIRLVKMLIAPIVFVTVVTGIAKMGDLKKVGRVGLKGIIYFEVLTTIALAMGGNREFARLAGVKVDRTQIIVFTVQGLVVGAVAERARDAGYQLVLWPFRADRPTTSGTWRVSGWLTASCSWRCASTTSGSMSSKLPRSRTP